ncbi:MAG: 2-oxo acid dehydrogenase subunit E2 [Spirochaetaceae bacterium]|nr:MAG: 2-oxo acid dehydrogenase subunit E2 [Spirochaetaceae bacterium]
MTPVIMPQIGQDVVTGIITSWYKKVGDTVQSGEVIATVEGEKASFDIEADDSGVLLQIVVEQGEEGTVLEPIGYIGEPGEIPVEYSSPVVQPAGAPTSKVPARPAEPMRRDKVFVSPSARRMAQILGVDLNGLKGSGPGGRIIKNDVLAVAKMQEAPVTSEIVSAATAVTRAPAPPSKRITSDTVIPFSRMRQTIAERLTLSSTTIPHFYLFQDIDMENPLRWREHYNRVNAVHITVTSMVVLATALTLREFPGLNAHVEKGRLVLKARINIGVATATDEGLLVPVIPDADGKDEKTLSLEIKARTTAARQGRLDAGLRSSFTVTSLGMYGIQSFLPIINPPEAAILGVGVAEPRPVAVNGLLGVRRVMTVVLASDHRAVDGAEAARFLQSLKDIFATRFPLLPTT